MVQWPTRQAHTFRHWRAFFADSAHKCGDKKTIDNAKNA